MFSGTLRPRLLQAIPSQNFVIALLLLFSAALSVAEQAPKELTPTNDSDSDGISDAIEQALLTQFAPTFMVSGKECSGLPAEFFSGTRLPTVRATNGTIYGEVFPAKNVSAPQLAAEIHFYHLWKQDCGAHGHLLDTEHVSVLVRASMSDLSTATWKALYWYAAAHQNTVCDASQITRAATVNAEGHGATIWISAGKHASFLNETLCGRGCGGDLCQEMTPMTITQIVNLGEPTHPMNGSGWIASKEWPLAVKMNSTDFPDAAIARLNSLPPTDIAWFNAGKHPMQATIAVSGTTANALANSGQNTMSAISVGENSTSNALKRSYKNTVKALGNTTRSVGKALHLSPQKKP